MRRRKLVIAAVAVVGAGATAARSGSAVLRRRAATRIRMSPTATRHRASAPMAGGHDDSVDTLITSHGGHGVIHTV